MYQIFDIYVVIGNYHKRLVNILSNIDSVRQKRCLKKGCRVRQRNTPAASLFSRKQGLGVPIRMKMSLIFINIYYYALLLSLIFTILIAY